MAIKYFQLEQSSSISSPITGDTVVLKWDDTIIPAGNTQSSTLSLLSSYPNSTWNFRSRIWTLTDLGSTTQSFDTEMLSNEPWSFDTTGRTVYVGFSFGIDVTIFAQNYIQIKGVTPFNSPRYSTNFYSASTFNDTSKVIGSDTNRYDFVSLVSQDDYTHITNSGVTQYNFAIATSITSSIVGGVNTLIPYSATTARTYFNGLYDGWVSASDDCDGNPFTSVNDVIYSGDMVDRTKSYSSIYGGPCLRLNNTQTPYSGNTSLGDLSSLSNIIDTIYSDCSTCESTNPYFNTYTFSAKTTCEGVDAIGQGIIVSANTINWGSPDGSGDIGAYYIQANGLCFGGGVGDMVQINNTSPTYVITNVYSGCSDCVNVQNPLDTYYYFSACTGGDVYRFNRFDYEQDFNVPTIGQVYLIENVTGMDDGCYTLITSNVTFIDIVNYPQNSTSTFIGYGCSDVLCSPSRSTVLADKLNSCNINSQSQKVFVFYDGTSLDETSVSVASESIRSWYNTKVINGDLLANNLYEGIIGDNSNNGENWLWWSVYPYLGSLTGGTVDGGTTNITEFNSAVNN